MVIPPLRIVYPLVAVMLVACSRPSIEEQVRAEGLAPAAVVRLADDHAVAARRDGGQVVILELVGTSASWEVTQIGSSPQSGPSSAQLISLGGDTGQEWNTFFYGTAPANVSRVVLEGYEAVGGQVVDGAWVLALREKDLTPDDMQWKHVDALGVTVESGTGIFPPLP